MQAKKTNPNNSKPCDHNLNNIPDCLHQERHFCPHLRGRDLQRTPLHHHSLRSASSRSTSKKRRSSKNKLFEKAHQAAQGETYLKDCKNQHSLHSQTCRLKGKTPEKIPNLGLHKQLDLKINGAKTDEQTSFSRLIMQFGCEDCFPNLDLSTIKQDGYQTASQFSFSQSLLKEIATG